MSDDSGLRPVKNLVALSPGVRARLGRGLALGALGGIASVAGYVCVAMTVGELFSGTRSTTALAWWAGSALGCLIVSFGARWLAEQVAHHASFDLEVVLRRRLADALARMPLGHVQRTGSGRIKKIVQDDVAALHNVVADAVPFFGAVTAQPIAALVALGIVQWKLLLVALLVLPIAMVSFSLMARDHTTQRARYNQAGEDVNAAVVEFVQGMPVVRTFDDGRTSFQRFGDAVAAFTDAVGAWTEATRRASGFTNLVIVPLPTLLVIAAGGVPMLAAGWITPGDLVLGLLVGAMPVESIAPLMHLTNYVNDAKAGAVRIGELLGVPPLPEPENPEPPTDSSVSLTGVTFRYTEKGAPVLDDVTLTVPEGTVCALVGPSGSGKSTVARLIPRFYDVDAGSVRVGGVDVRDIASDVLLRHVALVFQDPFLVSGTVAENIRLAKPDATDEEVVAAAKAAAAHEFITEELPDGYDSQVGERGGRLSGGQRQRITIARAMLSGAPVVVLDEATAFADPESEAAIQEALARLTAGRTVLVIAHRLTTITGADQIVVLDGGRVVERGTHPELIAAGGRYSALWARHEQAAGWGLSADAGKDVIA
ncbi:ABC transporter ATP-binding protein [Saccharopolyspora phatthalungensis]|uniref:ATP-binding cassette subfamily B protein n=1 Tax=Saccharopolyspora phatthalungensis TaxID=664693 RepID=A0A840QEZ3_9PSEU|nr:ABC transporter ATP-binding protein [Saccharopolyspora phatthalungensis]MBB5158996.1 ATP-binding cassette subfamily B protein [Saccharopolyspora phatthalungensis]